MGRRTRKQGGGGGEQSKAAPAPVSIGAGVEAVVEDLEDKAFNSIHYLLTLLRGGPIESEQVYIDLREQKAKLTQIVVKLEGIEDRLRDKVEPIESDINSQRREIQAPLARVRRGSFTQNNVETKRNANNNLRRLNSSANANKAVSLRGEISNLYTKNGADIRKIELTFYQEALKRLEPLVKLPQYCTKEEGPRIGAARDNLFGLTSILYDRAAFHISTAYERDLNR